MNLGTAKGYSVLEVIEVFKNLSKTDLNIKYSHRRPGDTSTLVTSYDKAKQLIHWSPNRNLLKIIYDYI
jgi:UDP-glucose 4-epimerase